MEYEFTISTAVNPAHLPTILADRQYMAARRAGLEACFRADSAPISYESALGQINIDLSAADFAPLWQLWVENQNRVAELCRELRFEKEQVWEHSDSLEICTDLTMVRGEWGFLGFMAMMIPQEIGVQISEKWDLTPEGIFRGKRQIKAAGLPISCRQSWEYQTVAEKGARVQIKIEIKENSYLRNHLNREILTVIGYNLLKLEEEIKAQWWGLKSSALAENKA